MRIVRLSTKFASLPRHQFRGTCTRLLHSSARMESVQTGRETPPAWLQRIVQDSTKPPKLYAWTLENLSADTEAGAGSRQVGSHGNADADRRIYILGVGNIGRLYAMCLSKLANRPPITLVVHRKELLEHWAAAPGIELTRHGQVHNCAAFDIEWWTDVAPPPCGAPVAEVAAGGHISNLIVATKAGDAVPQVDRLRRYLGSRSTVAFAQNGMCKLWPPAGEAYVRARFPGATSPNWIACVTTHGVTSQGQFKSVHAAPANALVGPVMAGSADDEQTGYLMRTIADAPDLDARQVSRKELWIAQLEKLVVNAIINPLTAVLRCKNGEVFAPRSDALPDVIDRLVGEASELLGALILDSKSDEILLSGSVSKGVVSGDATIETLRVGREELLARFSFTQLRAFVADVGAKVSANTSSMLQDVQAGKLTEIDDFNGWLVDTARLLGNGLRLPTHEKLIALVKGKATLTRPELCERLL
ncbi:ketoisovalerate reductase [Xylaria bambusicola]|uniref:ketoisovalerate reductase n=1 Tax=Xylaria bambusicola TaxID=326684 RepID=UPI0020085BCA|nr:ketoisovalerate reductase [Xylaria bambusicola]KAI0526645.1 ketoisovalerate reductase [Xylaria bambusicola]